MRSARSRHTSYGRLFRRSLLARLVNPRSGSRRSPAIVGGIDHDGGRSDVIITKHANPLVCSPRVNCREPWIRRSVHWHFLNFGRRDRRTGFCWVLDLEWKDHFQERLAAGEGSDLLCEDAAHWMVESMRLMLTRHWHGWEQGIDAWPKEWEDYSHGRAGIEEYFKRRTQAA